MNDGGRPGIGGLEGADEKCNKAGENLTGQYGIFRAILSTSFLDAKDRIPPQGLILNINGKIIASNKNDLFPLHDLSGQGIYTNLNQYGGPVGNAWWGSDTEGNAYSLYGTNPLHYSDFCGDWKDELASPQKSANQIPTYTLQLTGQGYGCNGGTPASLICISQ